MKKEHSNRFKFQGARNVAFTKQKFSTAQSSMDPLLRTKLYCHRSNNNYLKLFLIFCNSKLNLYTIMLTVFKPISLISNTVQRFVIKSNQETQKFFQNLCNGN